MLSALYALLTTDAGLVAINGTRVYPQVARELQPSAIVYQVIATPPADKGVSGKVSTTPRRWLIQIDCWACSYADAQKLADAVEAACDWYEDRPVGVERMVY